MTQRFKNRKNMQYHMGVMLVFSQLRLCRIFGGGSVQNFSKKQWLVVEFLFFRNLEFCEMRYVTSKIIYLDRPPFDVKLFRKIEAYA